VDLSGRALEVTRRAKAANQKDVGVLVVRVEANELRRVLHGLGDVSTRELCERRLMENRARRPGDVAALVLEPHLEPGAGPERQPVQQLVAEPG
jgi:hypothetical protein